MPLRPALVPDGYVQGHGDTYRRTWEYFDGPFEPPEPPDYVPSGPYSTPLEWWNAQAEFYGRPVPPFPGE